MERERPEYLPAIRNSRWEFPWLLVIGIVLLGMMAGGVHMLIRTNAAWAERFQTAKEPPRTVDPNAARNAYLAEIRLRRAAAETEAKSARAAEQGVKSAEMRCIGGTLFRRIPGGWENVPNRQC
ncbi:hypothetical protein BAY15_1960 [Stenotrophomonas rhizophila]|nr:hypothetical protein BAY15_1960 [Stenotrophomonas rhizophila]